MAKRFTTNTNTGQYAWGLHKCEDYLVIDAYMKVRHRVPNSDHKFRQFEEDYFEHGRGFLDTWLIHLNNHLKRCGYDVINFVIGHSDSWSITNGVDKADSRSSMLREMETLSEDKRRTLIAWQRSEASKLAPRIDYLDAIKGDKSNTFTIERRSTSARSIPIVVRNAISKEDDKKVENKEDLQRLTFNTKVEAQKEGMQMRSQDDITKLISEIISCRAELAEMKALLLRMASRG